MKYSGIALLLFSITCSVMAKDTPDDQSIFETPFRIKADGKPIKSNMSLAPVIVDIDGDGLKDLLTGSMSGKCTFYKNTGEPGKPKFSSKGPLKAGKSALYLQQGNG